MRSAANCSTGADTRHRHLRRRPHHPQHSPGPTLKLRKASQRIARGL